MVRKLATIKALTKPWSRLSNQFSSVKLIQRSMNPRSPTLELQKDQTRIRKRMPKKTLGKCRSYSTPNGEHFLTQLTTAKPWRRPLESQERPANTSFTASRKVSMPFTCFSSITKDHQLLLSTLKISHACSWSTLLLSLWTLPTSSTLLTTFSEVVMTTLKTSDGCSSSCCSVCHTSPLCLLSGLLLKEVQSGSRSRAK